MSTSIATNPSSRLPATLLVLLCGLTGCEEPQDDTLKQPTTTNSAPKFRHVAANPTGTNNSRPSTDLKSPPTYYVKFTTTAGDFKVRVNRKREPAAADRFFTLVKRRFFDNSHFYHHDDGRGIEFGLPADPTASAPWSAFEETQTGEATYNTRGTLSFVVDPQRNMERSTRVFINKRSNGHLDGICAVFGNIVDKEGIAVVDKLYGGYYREPDLEQIREQGGDYLDQEFPKLDKILSTEFIEPPEKSNGTEGEQRAASMSSEPSQSATADEPAQREEGDQ